eukprot:SAG11_NODE_18033_length_501_cov_4.947761_1_plen_39_part_10
MGNELVRASPSQLPHKAPNLKKKKKKKKKTRKHEGPQDN